MALPKPTNVLNSMRVLGDDVASYLVEHTEMLGETEAPSVQFFTDGQMASMRKGQPLLVDRGGDLMLVAYNREADRLIAFSVGYKEVRLTLWQRIKAIFTNK
jgi:hypothetical protein